MELVSNYSRLSNEGILMVHLEMTLGKFGESGANEHIQETKTFNNRKTIKTNAN